MTYLDIARSYIGLREVPGVQHNSTIQKWLTDLKAWWKDDETPWCGVFVAACLQQVKLPYPKEYYRARSYIDFGAHCPVDRLGCIVVLSRQGGGHVGFATGKTKDGKYLRILGGNQGNSVSEAWFEASRVVDSRVPIASMRLPPLPIVARGKMSQTEA